MTISMVSVINLKKRDGLMKVYFYLISSFILYFLHQHNILIQNLNIITCIYIHTYNTHSCSIQIKSGILVSKLDSGCLYVTID